MGSQDLVKATSIGEGKLCIQTTCQQVKLLATMEWQRPEAGVSKTI